MAYRFGRNSILRMQGVDEILTRTAIVALSFSDVDMSIPWRGGVRTAEEQKELFDDGASRCDGYVKKSYHQSGRALDIVPYKDGKIDYKATAEFERFAKIMFAAFAFLQAIDAIPDDVYLHWGGFWSAKDDNNDGYLHTLDDEFGWDCPHWELRPVPQRNVFKFK